MNLRPLFRNLTLCMILGCSWLSAQTDFGTIVGFVKDPSGGFIPKATVTLKNESTGIQQQVFTNDAGYYIAPNMAPGAYAVTVSAPGFKSFQSSANKLDPDSTLSVDVTLTVGEPTEKIDVIASTVALQTESAAIEKLVTRTQIDGLELNGRDPLFLASLQPGIRSNTTLGDFSFSLTNGGYAVNGARSNDTQITFDGAPCTAHAR